MAAYFGDLKDGVHKGDQTDPRISIIEVIPDEIRYWVVTKGTVGRALETAVSAVTKDTASLGELRTINQAEVSELVMSAAAELTLCRKIQLTQGLQTK